MKRPIGVTNKQSRCFVVDSPQELNYLASLDVRLSKIFQLGRTRIQGNLDVFNLLNSSSVLAVNQTYGSTWLQPTQIMPGRMIKLGFQNGFLKGG